MVPPSKRVRIGGVEYVELLLHVASKDVFNRAKGCTLIYEDEREKGALVGGEGGEYITVYVRADSVKAVGKDTV